MKTERLGTAVTAEERRMIEEAVASQTGATVSGFLREIALEKAQEIRQENGGRNSNENS